MIAATVELRITAEAFHLAKNKNKSIKDYHFIFQAPNGATTIDVVDGFEVRFKDRGVEPGEYSEELMLNALAVAIYESESNMVELIKIMKEDHSKTAKPGTLTTYVITLAFGGGELRFANVGDSGVKVLRRNAVAYESLIQQKGFNHLFQLSRRGSKARGGLKERAVKERVNSIVLHAS